MLSLTNNFAILDSYLDTIDGLIITGGDEAINPRLYNENPMPQVEAICPERDECEIYLIKKGLERNMPLLGVCRGMQLINVAEGGTLYQDVFNQRQDSLGHLPKHCPVDELYHTLKLLDGSKLHQIFQQDEISVNSFHHQAVKHLAQNYVATAFSEDNLIEGLEHKEKKFVVGVQWHPEDLIIRYPQFLRLFEAMITAAS